MAARPEVAGAIVDISADGLVKAARVQADKHVACPYAQNVLAYAIKGVVDRYRALNPLQYVVLVGSDDVIPFFRYPDPAPLSKESEYVPPVLDNTASQASLRLDYVLTQDTYGAKTEISLQNSTLPLPDLAVGRLVERAGDASAVVDAYLATPSGVVNPTTAFVSSYGPLVDGSQAALAELQAGLGRQG